MNNEKLELRMYGLVNYQLTGIQKGIQFGHAVVEYGQKIKPTSTPEEEYEKYNDWANNHKTFIILNGGTTNTNIENLGTMNEHLNLLEENGIFCAPFYEPDLGDQLTAVCFLVDERVFNKELYPDYDFNKHYHYEDWKDSIGGEKNVFLKNFLKNLKLA
jgi:hypothetical protein